MQYAFYFDQSRCTGCHTCLIACKSWNGVNPGPAKWRNLTIAETGTIATGDIKVNNLVMACNHCEEPVCVEVCPVDAIYKRDLDGIVVVERTKCIALKQCLAKCPFGSPQYGDDVSEPDRDPRWLVDHPMQKCHFCWDRWNIGKKPACVASCVMRAIDAGPASVLMERYPNAVQIITELPDPMMGMDGSTVPDTKPAILFKAK